MVVRNKFIGQGHKLKHLTIKNINKTKMIVKAISRYDELVIYLFVCSIKWLYKGIKRVYRYIKEAINDKIDYYQREKNIKVYDLDYDCDGPIVGVAVKNRRRRKTSFIEPESIYYPLRSV